jgi:hypothetical protein
VDPVSQALLGWMQQRGGRLHQLLDDEAAGADDHSPVSDAAIRAHLRFIAEALAAIAAPATRDNLEAFARELPERIDANQDRLGHQLAKVGDAAAFEVELQFGKAGNEDPLVRKVIERRMRVNAWHRFFLGLLDEAVGTDHTAATIAWFADNQVRLGDLIFATDRAANLIGQAATLQAHSRFLVEAIGALYGAG